MKASHVRRVIIRLGARFFCTSSTNISQPNESTRLVKEVRQFVRNVIVPNAANYDSDGKVTLFSYTLVVCLVSMGHCTTNS